MANILRTLTKMIFSEQDEGDITTPDTGQVSIFVDSVTKKLASKDDSGTVTNYGAGGGGGGSGEYGAVQKYISGTSYEIGAGARMVNGELLEWGSPITRSGLSLSANTLYYCYLYNNSGTPAVEESTTAPTMSSYRYWQKTGDVSRRMVGVLRTDGSGNIYRFRCTLIGNVVSYIYESGANASAPFLLVDNIASASSWTSFSFSDICPLNALQWYTSPKIDFTNSGDDGILGISPIDLGTSIASTASFTIRSAAARAGTRFFSGRAWIDIIPLTLSAYYRTQNIVGTVRAVIEIHGFRFEI